MQSSGARRAARALVAGAALAVAAASCSSTDATGPGHSYVGGWEGSTAAGSVVRFYVEDDGVPVVIVGHRVVGTVCTDSGVFTLHREPPDTPYPITSGDLAVALNVSPWTLTLAGTFASPTEASGTFDLTDSDCDGSLTTTWTASRAGSAMKDLTGTWTGTYTTSLVTTAATITITLQQSGSTLSGSYSSSNGAAGAVSGSVAGKVGRFTLTQTTAQCPGLFTGHAAVVTEGASVSGRTTTVEGGSIGCSGTGGRGPPVRVRAPPPAVPAAKDPTRTARRRSSTRPRSGSGRA
jgi:hypothetical protein